MSTIALWRTSVLTNVSESWLPDTNTNGEPARVMRFSSLVSNGEPLSVTSPAKNSGAPRAARSSAGSASTLLWRSEASVSLGSPVAAPR